MVRPVIEWTSEKNQKLREFWDTPMTYSDMGRALKDEHGPLGHQSIQKQLLRLGLFRDQSRRLVEIARKKWTPERLEYVKKRWLEGATSTQIAIELDAGITRNAIIGKVNRMGLVRSPKIDREVRSDSARRANKTKRVRRSSTLAFSRMVLPKEVPMVPEVFHGISIMELTDATCKAVIGLGSDKLARYCGHQTDNGKSFCPGHHALFYQPYERKR